mmetsp:Transcript_19581/g.49626  ORF Transcript_19581/g.49626 Transcript_19581/m.49626 type:complete len:206 (-) Transcript_19581:1266-1883(-)
MSLERVMAATTPASPAFWSLHASSSPLTAPDPPRTGRREGTHPSSVGGSAAGSPGTAYPGLGRAQVPSGPASASCASARERHEASPHCMTARPVMPRSAASSASACSAVMGKPSSTHARRLRQQATTARASVDPSSSSPLYRVFLTCSPSSPTSPMTSPAHPCGVSTSHPSSRPSSAASEDLPLFGGPTTATRCAARGCDWGWSV